MRSLKTFVLTATLTAVLALAACGGTPAAAPTTSEPAPLPVETVVETPAPVPAVPEYSQLIDGVLYEGSEKVPVRIGTDKPGEAPELETVVRPTKALEEVAAEHEKYVILVGKNPTTNDGWFWKVRGAVGRRSTQDVTRSWEVLGYKNGYYKTREEVLAVTFTADGRELDRSEYILQVRQGDRYVYLDQVGK